MFNETIIDMTSFWNVVQLSRPPPRTFVQLTNDTRKMTERATDFWGQRGLLDPSLEISRLNEEVFRNWFLANGNPCLSVHGILTNSVVALSIPINSSSACKSKTLVSPYGGSFKRSWPKRSVWPQPVRINAWTVRYGKSTHTSLSYSEPLWKWSDIEGIAVLFFVYISKHVATISKWWFNDATYKNDEIEWI